MNDGRGERWIRSRKRRGLSTRSDLQSTPLYAVVFTTSAMDVHELVWGSPGSPRIELVGGFGLLVGGTLLAVVVTNTLGTEHPVRRGVYDVGLPFVLFYAPGLVAAVGAYLRSGAVACLAVGLVPAALFATVAIVGTVLGLPGVGGGDAPLWSITVAFSAVGVVYAAVGYVVGVAIFLAVAFVR